MESTEKNLQALTEVIKTQPKNEESEFFKTESINHQNETFLHCKNCELLTFSAEILALHNCSVEEVRIQCPAYFLCKNSFTSIESLKIHLQVDHKVNEGEIDRFITLSQPKIIDCQFLKKTNSNELSNKSKSKIFIKDVTLLRKPDLPNTHINLPNIFDSLDLTTTDEDIFDDFLATDNEPDDFDFDFEEPSINTEQDDEIIAIADTSQKIYVKKNLTSDESINQNKIYVRSHESLTNQVVTTDVTQQPSESSTPDCVIVPSEINKEVPTQNKIFIRNIETLTNPQTQDPITTPYYDSNYVNAFPPSIYVRSYDSLVNESSGSERCKISIKNMDTLIGLSHQRLMHPPGIFGHSQNLVIHMQPNQSNDESLIGFRDTSVTPETLPGSSNVSTCGANDNDVIILDELNEANFLNFPDTVNQQASVESTVCNGEKTKDEVLMNNEVENPERNQTPNDKPKIDIQIHEENQVFAEDQPMTRIPIDVTNESNIEHQPTETLSIEQPEIPKKKMKIIKIIRVKKKSQMNNPEKYDPLDAVHVVFKCNIADCTMSFSNAKLLNYHKRCHLNESQIVCPECGSEEFKNYNTLHTHLWRQHGIDMDLFACKLCNFKTPILSRLKNFHEKIHSDERNYKCEFANCGKKFCNSKQLKNHSKIHKNLKVKSKICNDAKKIRCQICNKGFASESGLYIHFMEHKNEEKRFICEEKSCQYSTNDHNSFRRHKFQHSKTHQYSCPACDYTSIQSNTYRKHLEKQHKELAEELLYKCGQCKFVTISKSKYDGHVSKHMSDT